MAMCPRFLFLNRWFFVVTVLWGTLDACVLDNYTSNFRLHLDFLLLSPVAVNISRIFFLYDIQQSCWLPDVSVVVYVSLNVWMWVRVASWLWKQLKKKTQIKSPSSGLGLIMLFHHMKFWLLCFLVHFFFFRFVFYKLNELITAALAACELRALMSSFQCLFFIYI